MSSDFNHINRSNYEEYLLLYIDNELSPAEREAVEAFLQLHPDLQAELELLQSVVLPAEEVSFNKEELFAANMRLNSIDENLLLYIDEELPAAERASVALQIEEDETTRIQYQLLAKTKLDKNEVIPYPNKKELYRRTQKWEWLPVAAALLIMAVSGWLWLQPSSDNTPAKNVTAAAGKKATHAPATTVATNPAPSAATPVSEANNSQPVPVASTPAKEIKKQGIDVVAGTAQPLAEATPTEATPDAQFVLQRTSEVQTVANSEATDLSAQSLNKSLVTSAPLIRTTYSESATEDNNSKSPLKGLLRKATRFIERTTGINTTNENNEVLIAAVAVRLD